jgi:hypothetical protein
LRQKSGLSTGAALLLGLWVSAAQAQTVYRVVDAQGNVTFTDNPERGGKAITLAPKRAYRCSACFSVSPRQGESWPTVYAL